MNPVKEIFESHPYKTHEKYFSANIAKCIENCFECSSATWICADACLSEPHSQKLIECIKLCFSCSQISHSTARLVSVQHNLSTIFVRQQASACLEICKACAIECEKYQHLYVYCKLCAQMCRECENACQYLLYQSKLQ